MCPERRYQDSRLKSKAIPTLFTHRIAPKLSSSRKKPANRLSTGSRQKISNIIVKDFNLPETKFSSTDCSPGRPKKY